jgi:hypothetical protein
MVDSHKVWLIASISIAILIIAGLVFVPMMKDNFAGQAVFIHEDSNVLVGDLNSGSACANRAKAMVAEGVWSITKNENCLGTYLGIPIIQNLPGQIFYGSIQYNNLLMGQSSWDNYCEEYIDNHPNDWTLATSGAYLPNNINEAMACIDYNYDNDLDPQFQFLDPTDTGEEDCDPVDVDNGNVDPETCDIICNDGYIEEDTDGDGAGDACNDDNDNDGVADDDDNCPLVANGYLCIDYEGDFINPPVSCTNDDVCYEVNDESECNKEQTDTDDDGFGDVCDSCPEQDGLGSSNGCPVCEPDCTDKTCGDNGCDGDCGECGVDQICSVAGACISSDPCDNVECDSFGSCTDGVCTYDSALCTALTSEVTPPLSESLVENYCNCLGVDEGGLYPNNLDYCNNLLCDFDNDGHCAVDREVANPFELPDDDCDDTNDLIYPGAPEICDTLDNNCDDIIDEGCMALSNDDFDGDYILNEDDNCPLVPNGYFCKQFGADIGILESCEGFTDVPCDDECIVDNDLHQLDTDGDTNGDVCDDDDDGDAVLDVDDNCPLVANADQLDTDGDTLGDVCDDDDDADTVPDVDDNCPLMANADQLDTDADGFGDVCDDDDDADTVPDVDDNCLLIPNLDQTDTDEDGVGDACKTLSVTFISGPLNTLTFRTYSILAPDPLVGGEEEFGYSDNKLIQVARIARSLRMYYGDLNTCSDAGNCEIMELSQESRPDDLKIFASAVVAALEPGTTDSSVTSVQDPVAATKTIVVALKSYYDTLEVPE